MALKRLKDLPKDLDRQISEGFNNVIKITHFELSNRESTTPDPMPIWTGFFASSWKASNSPVIPNHKVENFQPWAAIKKERSINFFEKRKAGPPYTPQEPPANPFVQIRFPVGEGNRIFNYRKSVWIGNKAVYSQYVLESGKIQNFVVDDLAKIIKENMTEKGKLFIGGKVSEKFSGTTYTGF